MASTPTDMAPMAVRRATRAVASLSSDSPSRIVTIRRGSPIRRAIAVAATASGGATTAPMASEIGHEMPGMRACTMAPTPKVVNTTRPTESSRIARRLALKSTSEVWIAAAYKSGGSRPSSTISGSRWISGTPGRYDAATPTAISSSGAGKSRRSARAVNASTDTARATSRTAISTPHILAWSRSGPESVSRQAGWATQRIGSPQPSSSTPCLAKASTTRVRRCAAKVRTWAIIPP